MRGVMYQIVLMIILVIVETPERIDGRGYRPCKDMRLIQLLDVSLSNTLLIFVAVENRRPVLRADIGALAVELGGVMHHRKCNLQNLAVGNGSRVEGDFHGLRVAGGPGTYGVVLRSRSFAARVTRHYFLHAPHMFEYALHTPKTASGQHRSLRRPRRLWIIDGRGRDDHRRLRAEQGRVP